MKKLLLVILLVVMASALALSQVTAGKPTSSGSAGAVAPSIDVLGAHNNYGRGCAGCHSPHSGNAGAGGNGLTGAKSTDAWSGTNALFAQDMGPLLVGATLDFSDLGSSSTSSAIGSSKRYTLTLPSTTEPAAWTAQQVNDVRGIVMCLACHDGVVAKGAMMQNYAYEQQIGALPSSYGPQHIPTLLGISGAAAGFSYNNQHPVGDNATMSAVLGCYYDATCPTGGGLTYSITNGTITGISPSGQYSQFMASYGFPALAGVTHGTTVYYQPVNAGGVPYIVCTTCHNQHVMNVYAANTNSAIANATTGTYATYFFVNGPYNINNVTAALNGYAQSTTQFCRQCHFAESNEANGGPITTQF